MQSHLRKSKRQHGLSMLIALIALLILSLTAVALVRSVDTGTAIIGNFSFKQDATEAASTGAERAMTWLESQSNLDSDLPAFGYYASSVDTMDPTGNHTSASNKMALVDWDGSGACPEVKSGTFLSCNIAPYPGYADSVASAVNGNRVQWVITRLCNAAGPVSSNICLTPGIASAASANDRGELAAGGRISSTVSGPYYRIIVRSSGARNTVAYTETIVHW